MDMLILDVLDGREALAAANPGWRPSPRCVREMLAGAGRKPSPIVPAAPTRAKEIHA